MTLEEAVVQSRQSIGAAIVGLTCALHGRSRAMGAWMAMDRDGQDPEYLQRVGGYLETFEDALLMHLELHDREGESQFDMFETVLELLLSSQKTTFDALEP